jgi:capsid protein
VLAGALDLDDPVAARAVQWIPPRWDWVEATGYDIEEVDRENAADARRAADLGLSYRTSPGETQGARATPERLPDPEADTAS